ncbi:MAG TPA: EAL domain-containing protein [Pseudorhizobium sp.]|nr:EAL domain-containing protein [Pseudorhizobium sp.]
MPLVLPATALVGQLDHKLFDLRAESASRRASDRFVFLAIDKESLDHVGTWPWPRSVHAAVVDALVAAGAADIFLDIDFSTPSTPAEDEKLAAALARAGGGVILPVFEQHQNIRGADSVEVTRPIPLLGENAWLAAANVRLDGDGSFRAFDAGLTLDGQLLPSASVLLSGVADPEISELGIDYSIRPETVAAFSVADLLRGEVDADLLAGRSIVVGAYATELKDLFPVPVYGILSGPMLHILAAETLLQNRLPWTIPAWPGGLLIALAFVVGAGALRRWRLAVTIPAILALALAIEGAGYALQKEWSLQLPSATFHLMLMAGFAILLLQKIGFGVWLLEIASAERRNTRRILKRVVNDSADAVIIVSEEGLILDHSRAAARLFGASHELRRGEDFRIAAPAQLAEAFARLHHASAEDGKPLPTVQDEFTISPDGEPLHLEATLTMSRLEDVTAESEFRKFFVACITVRNVTARKTYEAKLRRLSQLDDLTGVLNRREIATRLAQSVREGRTMAVVALDLHRFATVNATFGRGTGDQLLRAVAKRLMAGCRKISIEPAHAFVARLGSDVFCLAVALDPEEGLDGLPVAVLALFEKSLDARGAKIHVDVRMGACLVAGVDPAAAIDGAELALDEAKKIGGSGWSIYEPAAALEQARKMRIEHDMRRALREEQFFLLYQPQVDLETGKLVGAEALIRWRHPEMGLVSPSDFIEVAESNGFICNIGRWVLAEACSAASAWPTELSVAVNVSALQFAKGDLCADVRHALAVSGLDPHRLHVEVTESTFLLDPTRLLAALHDLKSMGVGTALDDFGTGYSSLSYIARFPFDKIKVDQCFVRGIVVRPESQAIVRSVTSLAEGLGMTVVCEGIEEEAEWRMLAEFGCQQGQGYYFGKPQTADELMTLAGQAGSGVRATA